MNQGRGNNASSVDARIQQMVQRYRADGKIAAQSPMKTYVVPVTKDLTLEERDCEVCGKTYSPPSASSIVCSKQCAHALVIGKAEPQEKGRRCKICNTAFTPASRADKTCGDEDCVTRFFVRQQRKGKNRKRPLATDRMGLAVR